MRLDQYLNQHQMVKSRSQATDLIKRGIVLVDDEIIYKTGFEILNQSVKIIEEARFVSRGGEKLMQALVDFNLVFNDKIVIDIGSSTGGFTDCALQHGAKLVYAYDVGYEQMDSELKKNTKIILNEQTNILDVSMPLNDIIVIDVSFTSIKPILNHIKDNYKEVVALIKPQFEAGHIKFKQGVLKDLKKHKDILDDVLTYAASLGFNLSGLEKSNLKGKSGNQEYILYMNHIKENKDVKQLIGRVL
jgi:23S rRNA (cytidine1920-2'-O)/16S rRNA (cytidine1409-2'-O)-methyltransferase